jgi:hypothetical protein
VAQAAAEALADLNRAGRGHVDSAVVSIQLGEPPYLPNLVSVSGSC